MDRDTLLDGLREVVEAHEPAVQTAYLFGSWSRGEARSESDVDLAVIFEQTRPRTLGGLPTELAAEAGARLGVTVDVVDLERSSADLVHRVLRDGVLVLDRDPATRIRFEVHRRNQYFDLLPHLQRYRQART